jgi:hypothetical protein
MQAAAAAAARKAAAGRQVVHLSPDDQHAAMQQQQFPESLAPAAYGWHSSREHAKQQGKGALSSEVDGSTSCAMQPNLQFENAELEGRFVASQAQQWARMDAGFVAMTMLLLAAAAYSSTAQGLQQQLLLSLGHWLVPAVAGCWMLLQPISYCKHREAVWAVHRALAALQTAGVLVLCVLQQQWLLASTAAGVAAHSLLGMRQNVAGMLRRRALGMLVESLGFKVRCCT